jgi:hypothetical protein
VLLAAFVVQVGEREFDGGVGLEDAQAGHAVEVLLPTTSAITGSGGGSTREYHARPSRRCRSAKTIWV